MSRDRRAVGGFFEEMTAFVIVVVSLALFITSALAVHGTFHRDREQGSLAGDCYRLSRAFRGYEGVLERSLVTQEPLSGCLDAGKLNRLNRSTLERELGSPHPFNLTVLDRATGQSWSFGPTRPAGPAPMAKVTTAIAIRTPDGLHEPGSLEVVMWE